MPEYRIFSITGDDHVAGPPQTIECDAEAIEQAKQLLDERDVEGCPGPGRHVPWPEVALREFVSLNKEGCSVAPPATCRQEGSRRACLV